MKGQQLLRFGLAALLVGAAILKLGWPDTRLDARHSTVLAGVAVAELALGVGILSRRAWHAATGSALVLFSVLVGFNVGQIAKGGLGAITVPCGCMGRAADPSRGAMLIVASIGLGFATLLGVGLGGRAGGQTRIRDKLVVILALLGLCGASLVSWSGLLAPSRSHAPSPPTTEPENLPRAPEPTPPPTLAARSPEHPPAEKLPPPAAPPPPRDLLVTVVEAGSGRPIEGAAVWTPEGGSSASTSVKGEARLSPGRNGEPFEVVARSRAGLWSRVSVPADSAAVTIEFSQEVSLSGSVRWADGSVAAGYKLKVMGTGSERAEDSSPTPQWSDRRIVFEILTDADGRFEVKGLGDENRVGVRSLEEHSTLLPPGLPDPGGAVWLTLPALDLNLTALAGFPSSVQFVDERSGGPVAGVEASIDWEPELSGYAKAQRLETPRARLWFIWPAERGTLAPLVSGHASARGFVAKKFEIRDRDRLEDGASVVRLVPDASGRLIILHPWGDGESMRQPQFSVFCDDKALTKDPVGQDVVPVAQESGKWVFAGLPAGTCRILCYGREIASKDLAPGEEATVQARLNEFSRVLLRPRRDGKPITGVLKLLTRGVGSVQAREVEVPENGTIELFPIPTGVLRVSLARSTEVSSPETVSLNIPGGGETVEVDVQMVTRR